MVFVGAWGSLQVPVKNVVIFQLYMTENIRAHGGFLVCTIAQIQKNKNK